MAYGNAFAGSCGARLRRHAEQRAPRRIHAQHRRLLGYGGRLYARARHGQRQQHVRVSFFTGKTRDKIVAVTGTDPLVWATHDSYEYSEYVGGADASNRHRQDSHPQRGRNSSAQVHCPASTRLLNQTLAPFGQAPDKWEHSIYLLVAQQLPARRLDMFEPYLWAEAFPDADVGR